jgi:hypothetical protein
VADSASEDIDALFKLPLGEFTSARNALAAQLKKGGRQAEASAAKALAKPSASAWVVNQLYWRHRKVFDRLIETGERLRRAHAAGEDARAAGNARRAVLGELTAIATSLLRDASHNATRELMRRVTGTLEALSSYGALPGAPAAGRLIDDLQPPGFEAVAGLLSEGDQRRASAAQIRMRFAQAQAGAAKRPGRAQLTLVSAKRDDEDRKRRGAAAKTAVREAERMLNTARKRAERAVAKREAAATRAKEIELERARIEKQLAEASARAKAAQAIAEEAAAQRDEATQAAASAERALAAARDRLQEVTAKEG